MVSSRVIREELIGTRFILARTPTGLVFSEICVPEDLVGGVVVVELWQIGRQVGDNVLVVDNAVDVGDAVVDVPCQIGIANPGCSKVMDFHIDVEHSLQFHASNHRQSPAQTVPSSHHLSSGVLIQQTLHLIVDRCLDCSVVSEEAGVDFAAQTEQVWHFFEVKVFNPVLDVGGAPERHDDRVSRRRIPDVSRGLS